MHRKTRMHGKMEPYSELPHILARVLSFARDLEKKV
jgi:hypothetical protein